MSADPTLTTPATPSQPAPTAQYLFAVTVNLPASTDPDPVVRAKQPGGVDTFSIMDTTIEGAVAKGRQRGDVTAAVRGQKVG